MGFGVRWHEFNIKPKFNLLKFQSIPFRALFLLDFLIFSKKKIEITVFDTSYYLISAFNRLYHNLLIGQIRQRPISFIYSLLYEIVFFNHYIFVLFYYW